MTDAAYEARIVVAFLHAHGVTLPSGTLTHLNGKRVNESQRDKVRRWTKRDTVPLAKVDAFLTCYGLMLFELEDWAHENYGRNGFLQDGVISQAVL